VDGLRVALFAAAFPPAIGGIERFCEVLANWLTEAGHEVRVLTPTPADSDYDRRFPFEVTRRPGFTDMVRAARHAEAVHVKSLSSRAVAATTLAGHRAVITHAHHQAICPVETAWGEGGVCTAGPGSPGPCPTCPSQGPRAYWDLRRQRSAALVARRNVCISDYLKDRLGLPRSVTVFNPVEERAFAAGEPDAEREGDLIAFAGRLSLPKGLHLLIEAVSRLPGIRLEVAGDGPARAQWESLARDLGVANRVQFLGSLDFGSVAALYRRAGVVCVPSIWQEPFGYSVAEAMAMGCAVVGTPSGAIPELLAGGRGHVSADLSAAALSEALATVLADDRRRPLMGRRARDYALENLRLDVIGPSYLALYRS